MILVHIDADPILYTDCAHIYVDTQLWIVLYMMSPHTHILFRVS